MESGVETVVLSDEVTLDMEALAKYSGQGVCRQVEIEVNTDTAARYREDLLTWARSRNWRSHLIKNLGNNFNLGRIVYCAEQRRNLLEKAQYSSSCSFPWDRSSLKYGHMNNLSVKKTRSSPWQWTRAKADNTVRMKTLIMS